MVRWLSDWPLFDLSEEERFGGFGIKGQRLTARHADGQALEVRELSLAQVCFQLATGRVQSCLVLLQFSSVLADLFYVRADLLAVPIDLFFAGAIADIAPKLGSIFSQLLIIPTQLLAAFFDFIACIANIFEILSNLGFIMMPTVVMTNITPVVMPVISPAMIPSASVIAVPPPVIALPLAMLIVFPEVRILLSILGVGSHRCSGDN
jgi:hypothetical protein